MNAESNERVSLSSLTDLVTAMETENATLRARVEELADLNRIACESYTQMTLRKIELEKRVEELDAAYTVIATHLRWAGEFRSDNGVMVMSCPSGALLDGVKRLAAACSAKDEALAEIPKLLDGVEIPWNRIERIHAALLRAGGGQ